MLTFEGAPIQGVGAIIEKLAVNPFISVACFSKSHHILFFATQSLPFQKVQHKVTTLDAQPSSGTTASLIVSVTGLLVVSTGRKTPPAIALITHRLGRRQPERTAVLPGVPSYPRGWGLLRVRTPSPHTELALSLVLCSFNDIFRLNYG
jgi:hypothetical protein